MKIAVASFCLLMSLTAAGVTDVLAEGEKPIQLSLVNPIQIVNEKDSIKGLRLNLIYTVNHNLTGVDLGLINRNTGNVSGLQWSFAGIVEGDFTGWQNGIGAITEGHFKGFQSGLFNQNKTGEGFQWGAVNVSKDMRDSCWVWSMWPTTCMACRLGSSTSSRARRS